MGTLSLDFQREQIELNRPPEKIDLKSATLVDGNLDVLLDDQLLNLVFVDACSVVSSEGLGLSALRTRRPDWTGFRRAIP